MSDRIKQNPDLPPRLSVIFAEENRVEKTLATHFDQGLFLARQEAWDQIGPLIRGLDGSRDQVSDGRSTAVALAAGARHDAVTAAKIAVGRQDEAATVQALSPLDQIFEEHCEDHGIAYVVAMAHIETAEAWHGAFENRDVPPAHRTVFYGHMRTASLILDRFDPIERNAPTLCMARCRLLPSLSDPGQRVSDDFEDLIEINPTSPIHLRQFGQALLPRLYGDHQRLETEARRIMMLTRDIWGAGAYTWMYLDPLTSDPAALDHVDPELFVEGMHDILAACDDQSIVNEFAVLCGVTLARALPTETSRHRIAQSFGWVLRDHLREVHPLVWAKAPGAPDGLEERRMADFGRSRAMQVLAQFFTDDLVAGRQVSLSATGVEIAENPARSAPPQTV